MVEISRTSKKNPFLTTNQRKNTTFYFKFFLSASLSFYFFTFFLLTHNPNLGLIHHHHYVSNSNAFASKALVQSEPNDFKLFVYDLPPEFNADWLSDGRCGGHLFASEVAIHRALLTSRVRCMDPYEADFFFVPVYVSCNFSSINGLPAIAHARPLLASAVAAISREFPFWNRSGGADHIFVASHDYGACFHAMEHEAMADGIPQFLKHSIILQTFGVKYKHPCQDVENILIPPYIPPESVEESVVHGRRRDIFAFFRGKMEAGSDFDLEEISPAPAVLHQKAEVCWLPVGNKPVGFLFMSSRVGPVESEIG